MHRPRFRLIISNDAIDFHKWWEPCKEYKTLIETYNIPKDNFKSFPSGHTAEVCILLVCATFFPLANEKYQKIQLPAYLCACFLVLFVALARILAGAHFLSDVSMGATLVLIALIIANEVVIHIKPLHIENQQVKTQD